VAWRGLASICKYIHKGDKVVVKGMINYREYEKDGVKHYVTDIVASDIILTTKGEGGRPPLTANDVPAQTSQPQQQYVPQQYDAVNGDGELPF